MSDAPAKTRMTLAEFHELIKDPNAEKVLELIDGEVVEKSMVTHEHGYLVARIIYLISFFLESQGLPTNLGPEIRFEASDDENSRLPDLAVFLDPNQPIKTRGAVTKMPEIAVEVQSPDDTRKELRDKAEYYLADGAKLAWIVYPKPRRIEVMTLDDAVIYDMGDTIKLDDLLPGFALEVAKVFNYPREE